MAQPDSHFTEYVRTGSDAAFRAIVTRHMPMVHSAARRLLGGRADAAADVAQAVFCQLARRAATLPEDLVVSIWLHTQTVRAALNVIRAETRRAARERTAADLLHMNAPDDDSPSEVNAALTPHIDRAIAELPAVDQRALALRFFEKLELREVGDRLGLSAGAVQKRLTRALEKLRGRLSRRGVALSVAGLTVWLSQEAVQAAPASLTASTLAAAAALQPAASGGGGIVSFLTVMSGLKSLVIGTVLGLVGGGAWAAWPGAGQAPAVSVSSTPPASLQPGPEAGGAAGQRFAVPVPAATAEGLVAQLMDLISGPDNELTRQRVAAWLEAVPREMWTGLVELADGRLSEEEHRRWLPVLARQWAMVDPLTAIPALADGKRVDGKSAATLAAIGFRAWHEADPAKALHWLMEQQDNPKLQKALPGIITVVAESLAPDDAVRWASRLQGDDLRAAALKPIWKSVRLRNDVNAWNEACGKLLQEEDPVFRRFALTQALAAWSKGADTRSKGAGLPAAKQWLATLPPSPDKSVAAAFLLGEEIRFSGGTPPTAVTEALSPADSQAAARVVMEAKSISLNARGWLLPMLKGPEREAAILHAARTITQSSDGWTSAHPSHGEAIQWAAELSDPAIRDPLVYGLFQEWLEWRKSHMSSTDFPARWTEKAPLAPEITAILKTARQDFDQKGEK